MQDTGPSVTRYRKLGEPVGDVIKSKWLYILSICGAFITFLLFVLWILILVFLVNIDVRDLNHNENLLSSAVNSYIVSHPSTDGGDGGDGGDGDGGDGDGGGSNTYNTYNTFNTETYSYYNTLPLDGLLTSVYNNKFYCDLAPPVSSIEYNLLNATFKTLERTWSDLMTDLNIPGVAIGVVYNNDVVYKRGFGTSNSTLNTPVASNTIFRIGGLTRLFTTLAAFALRERGSLSLDTPLVNLLPTFTIGNPFNSQNITIRQLLGDISGLPRNAPPGCEPYSCPFTTDQVLQLISQYGLSLINPPYFLPSRSDLAFSLAGRALEKVPGQTTYENAVATLVTNKLNMPDTVFSLSPAQQSRASLGYENGGVILDYDSGWLRPWGGLYSTLDDMLKFMIGLNALDASSTPNPNSLLSTQTLREMELPLFINPDTKTGQGTPFQMIYLKNKVARTLGGAVAGFGSHMILVPNLRIGIIAMANTEVDMSQFTTPAAVALIPLIEQLLTAKAPLPVAPPSPTNFFGRYYGVNSKGELGVLTVTGLSTGVLNVADDRYPATVFYELNYKGVVNGAMRFTVNWKGDPLFLSCLEIQNTANEGALFDFYELHNGKYQSLVFQGEQYLRLL